MRGAVAIAHALAAALLFAPLLFLPLPLFLGNSDALFYTNLLRLVADHMAAGDFRPLWLPEANGGSGSPVMLFYGPLALQLTALLGAPVAAFDPSGAGRLMLGMFAANMLSGIAAYIWLSRSVRPSMALAASLLFVLFPYRLVTLYLHVNLAQLWALVFLPPLMIASADLADGRRRAYVWYGLWLALIALAHPRTVIAFAWLPALYALIFAARPRLKILWRLVLAHLLAFALAGFYLFPAFLNLDLVRMHEAASGRFHYAANLSHRDVALNFHYLIILALCIGMLFRLPSLRGSRAAAEIGFYSFTIIAVALLCLRISQPLWDALPLLQLLQFPAARLHAPALIAATALAAFFLHYGGKVRKPAGLYSPAVMLIPVLAMAGAVLHHIDGIYRAARDIDAAYIESMHASHTIPPAEYRTRWQDAGIPPELSLVTVRDGAAEASASFSGFRTLDVTARVEGENGALLRLGQLYLPGWKSDGGDIGYNRHGLLTLRLPPGDHHLTLTLEPFAGEEEGRLTSFCAFLLLILLLAPRRRTGKYPHHSHF